MGNCCGGGGGGPGNDPFSSFSSACYTGNMEKLQDCLKKEGTGAVNKANEEGVTPIHRAAQKGSVEVIKLLMSNGANPCVQNKNQETPLHLSCFHRHKDAVNEFLRTDARRMIDTQDQHGFTALHYAVNVGDADIVVALLNSGASPRIKNKYDQDAADMAKHLVEQERMGLSAPNAKHSKVYEQLMKTR